LLSGVTWVVASDFRLVAIGKGPVPGFFVALEDCIAMLICFIDFRSSWNYCASQFIDFVKRDDVDLLLPRTLEVRSWSKTFC
jgi:hypothetical protein